MKDFIVKLNATVLAGCVILGSIACNKSSTSNNAAPAAGSSPVVGTSALPSTQHLAEHELDELVAPIALYPDPLLAQIIPASTFIDQLSEASRTLGGRTDDNLIDDQNWDVSVKSVAHYPPVLQMMVDKPDWTTTLGQAYVNQPADLDKAIQRMRADAQNLGNLVSTPEQQVIDDGSVIRIVPAQPKVVYVPQYDPEVVYVEKGPSTAERVARTLITFTAGMAIGAWLNNDYDYYGRGIYYHGWVGPGWIGVNRTFVNVNRNVYINERYRNINVNRNIVHRNVTPYRANLTRNAGVRRDRINASRVRHNVDRRPDVARGRTIERSRATTVERSRPNTEIRRQTSTARSSQRAVSTRSQRTSTARPRNTTTGARRRR